MRYWVVDVPEAEHEERLRSKHEVLWRRGREDSSAAGQAQLSTAQSFPRAPTYDERTGRYRTPRTAYRLEDLVRALESAEVATGIGGPPRTEQLSPPRALPLPKYDIRVPPVIRAVMLDEEGLRVSRRKGGGVVIAVKFREPIRTNSVVIDDEVKMRVIKTEGVGLRLVRPVLKQGVVIKGISISDHVPGINAEQLSPPRAPTLLKYIVRVPPVIEAVKLDERELRVSKQERSKVTITVKFCESTRINPVIIDDEVRIRVAKTEGIGSQLVKPMLKQGIMIEGVSISDHVPGIGAVGRGTPLPRPVIKSPPQLGAREMVESTLRYAVPNEPIEKLGETIRESEIASEMAAEQEEVTSLGREELGRVDVVAGEVEGALEGALGELGNAYSVLDYVIDVRPGGSGAFLAVDRFVRVFVHDTGWELKVVADVCSLYAESLIGRMSEPEVYTLTKEDVERAKMLLRDSVRRGVVMEFRSLRELSNEKELVLDLLDRADGINYLGYLVMPIWAVPPDILKRDVQPVIEGRVGARSVNVEAKLRDTESVCVLALVLSGFRPELVRACEVGNLNIANIISYAVGTFRDFLTNVNKEFVVNYLNKPSTGEEESALHRHLKGWAIQWLINKYFRDIARDTERLKEWIKVEEGGSCGVPDIFVKLPDGRKLIIEVKTLIGRGQNPVWDELYHNSQIRNYVDCADEVWILVPPWIPALFTKDILNVQRVLWSELGRHVNIVTISFNDSEELGEPIPVVDFIKRAINEFKARTNKEKPRDHMNEHST